MPFYVRVKRKATDRPPEFLETHKSAKRTKCNEIDLDVVKFTYKGSYTNNDVEMSALPDLDNLCKEETRKSEKVAWDSYSASFKTGELEEELNFKVNIHNEWVDPKPNANKKTVFLDKPVLYRVIDLLPSIGDDSDTLKENELEHSNDRSQSENVEFLYDIYEIDVDKTKEEPYSTGLDFSYSSVRHNKAQQNVFKLNSLKMDNKICIGSDRLFSDSDEEPEDDEDSNSENNFRNDYPDEDELSTSSLDSSSSLSSVSDPEDALRKFTWRGRGNKSSDEDLSTTTEESDAEAVEDIKHCSDKVNANYDKLLHQMEHML